MPNNAKSPHAGNMRAKQLVSTNNITRFDGEIPSFAWAAARALQPRQYGYGAPGATAWAAFMRQGQARRRTAHLRLQPVAVLVEVGGGW